MALEDERRFQEYVIDRVMPIHVALKYVDGQERGYNGKCFCPFHENHDTPAAHIYKTENGSHLMCFAERRSYKPHHVFTEKLVSVTLARAFHRLWNQLNPDTQELLRQKFGQPVKTLPKSWYGAETELSQFKLGKVSLYEHLCKVAEVLSRRE